VILGLDPSVRLMRNSHLGIAVGAERRLRQAIEAQIRAKYHTELSACSSRRQRVTIEEKIQKEIQIEMKRVASPYSLWGSL